MVRKTTREAGDAIQRAATGVKGLDDILGGGLPTNHLYLIDGDPGTGKTTLALQFLLKIEAGHVAVNTTAMGLASVIKSLREFVEPQLREKRLHFTMADDFPETEACGDPDKVRQILINLLSNAIKFTPEGGHIKLECDDDAEMICITVEDDGAGIPADKLDAIFEPFVQVNRDYAPKHEGTGLGLAISRDLARRMGGDLTVKSELGKGSRFTLALPRA